MAPSSTGPRTRRCRASPARPQEQRHADPRFVPEGSAGRHRQAVATPRALHTAAILSGPRVVIHEWQRLGRNGATLSRDKTHGAGISSATSRATSVGMWRTGRVMADQAPRRLTIFTSRRVSHPCDLTD